MNILDDISYIKKLDSGQTLISIKYLPDQCLNAWNDIKNLSIPASYHNPSNIIFAGMGGSAYGGRIIKSLFFDQLKIPVEIVSDYHLPHFANQNSLVIAASYSGNTEETLSCIGEALERNCKIIGISSGGRLAEILMKAQKPVYKFDPLFNPSNQPRIGQGYMQIGQIALLAKMGFISFKEKEFQKIIKELKTNTSSYDAVNPETTNPVKKLAGDFQNKIVNIIGAQFLEGAIHSIRNPFHETGKHFANYFILPELNHHLMEGLSYPVNNPGNLLFFLIKSNLYSDNIKKRMELTGEVVEKNNIAIVSLELKSDTKTGQVFETIQIGSFITFYLAMLHNLDPVKIPWVDYFKGQLKKNLL